MADLFKAPLVPATLVAMSRKASERLKGVASHLQDLIAQQVPAKHLDETGFRMTGCLQWLHIACTPLLAFYTGSSRTRGHLLSNLTGCIVHDHGQSTSRWMVLPMRCAMLIIYENYRRWSKLNRKIGPPKCRGSCVEHTMSHK